MDCSIAADQDPVFCSIVTCVDPLEQQTCPWSCGLCTSTTTSTTTVTTTTVCADPGCLYGFIWDTNLCMCNCNNDVMSAFTGPICQNVDCTKAVDADPVFCSIVTCTDPTEKQSSIKVDKNPVMAGFQDSVYVQMAVYDMLVRNQKWFFTSFMKIFKK